MKCFNILKISSTLIALSLMAPVYAANTTTTKVSASDPVDAKILSVVVALDSNEILAGVQAVNNKSSSREVGEFGQMMIKEHGDNFAQALALANTVNALPLNPNPNDMRDKGAKEVVKLAALDGDAYNSAYVNAMVDGHQAALGVVDKLLTTAKNSDVKTFLTDTRTTIAHHLDEAKKLQASMRS